jgi:hypothetical protein
MIGHQDFLRLTQCRPFIEFLRPPQRFGSPGEPHHAEHAAICCRKSARSPGVRGDRPLSPVAPIGENISCSDEATRTGASRETGEDESESDGIKRGMCNRCANRIDGRWACDGACGHWA